MRVRILKREENRNGTPVDTTPPKVEIASGEYRAVFERGKEYIVTSTEWQILAASGQFESVPPAPVAEGEQSAVELTDREILEARLKADGVAYDAGVEIMRTSPQPKAEVAEGETSTSNSTAQQSSLNQTTSELKPVSESPGDKEARLALEGEKGEGAEAKGEGSEQNGGQQS